MAGGYQTWPLIEFTNIGDAWRLYKRHWFIWSLAMIIVSTVYSCVAGAAIALVDGHAVPRAHGGFRMFLTPGVGAVPFLVSTVISLFLVGGLVRMASRQLRGEAPRIEDLFSVTDVWFDLLLVSFLNGLATFLAFMFCAVPGFIVSGLFMLAIPLVVESKLPATGALIQSWNALKSQWLVATIFHCALILATISGALLCGVGIFLTGPIYALGTTLLYQRFFGSLPFGFKTKHAEPFPEI